MACESCDNQQVQQISLEQYLEIQKNKIVAMNKEYVKNFKNALKKLQTMMERKDKDRMDYAVLLVSIISLMNSSCQGWAKWCTVVKLNEIFKNKEDLKKIIEKMLQLTKDWIQIDIDITEKQINDIKTKEKKSDKKSIKSKKSTTYVA